MQLSHEQKNVSHNVYMFPPSSIHVCSLRYMPLINFYAVFEPSVDAGASFPKDAYGQGGHPSKGEVIKNNNLDCKYGTEAVRLLNCDHRFVSKLLESVHNFNIGQRNAFEKTSPKG